MAKPTLAELKSDGKPHLVEEYLNSVNYAIDPNYVPSEFALEFVNFIKLVGGDPEDGKQEDHATPITHYYMLDTLTHGGKRIANMCSRGLAKTTILAEYMILYLALYHELPGLKDINLVLYVSDSIENGVKNLRKNLEHRRTNSEFLMQYIPSIKFTDVRYEFTNIDGETLVVKGYGAKTGVRGAKEMAVRPQLAILDDLISDEDARSPTVISSIEDTIYQAVENALLPKNNKIIWSGTPFNARDPLYKAIESGAWDVNVFPVCEQYPCTEEEFVSAWPDRFDYEFVKEQYDRMAKLGKVSSFNQELMLRIISDEERLVMDSDINWYSLASLLSHRHNYNFYITTDLASSVKRSADYSVISVWAYNNNGDWLWVDGSCERNTMDKNIEMLFNYVAQYRPQQVGLEVSGQQHGFVNWINTQMIERNCFFNLASDKNGGEPGIRPVTEKLARFNIMLPFFKLKKFYFPAEKKLDPVLLEAMEELSLLTKEGMRSKHDDFLDTISQLASLTPWKPGDTTAMQPTENGIWENEEEAEYSAINDYVV